MCSRVLQVRYVLGHAKNSKKVTFWSRISIYSVKPADFTPKPRHRGVDLRNLLVTLEPVLVEISDRVQTTVQVIGNLKTQRSLKSDT